ncbi:MAG: hypothetical protein SWY16_00875 [Cyanobacteriota bacterium]|nr:hypothetical protein [Cyanobacteriota bacterium]
MKLMLNRILILSLSAIALPAFAYEAIAQNSSSIEESTMISCSGGESKTGDASGSGDDSNRSTI